MLAAMFGGAAAFLSLFTHPSHIAYLLKHRGDEEIYRGVSVASLFLISISSVNWVVYGFAYAGVFTAVVATSNIIVKSLLLYLLWRQGRVGTTTVLGFAAALAATTAVSLAVSQNVLGFLGTVIALEGAGDNAVASVDFGTEGVKRLLLRYAPLTKVEG